MPVLPAGGLRILLPFLFALLFTLPPVPSRAEHTTYLLGVVPQMPPVAMHTNWTPLVARLAEETGLAFKLMIYEKMDDFEEDFQDGNPDFLFSSPTQIVLARRTQGYIPLVRSSKEIKGVLFVRKDSPYQTAKDLEGKNIAFVGHKNL